LTGLILDDAQQTANRENVQKTLIAAPMPACRKPPKAVLFEGPGLRKPKVRSCQSLPQTTRLPAATLSFNPRQWGL
jgi:hypothetical protein